MTEPLVDPSDLATYLGLDSIDVNRAVMLLSDAQSLCESVLTPLPESAAGIVRRIAGRAYINPSSATSMGIGTANVSFASTSPGMGVGGIYLSNSDKSDLRRLAGGGGAFSIRLIPDDSVLVIPPWDDGTL